MDSPRRFAPTARVRAHIPDAIGSRPGLRKNLPHFDVRIGISAGEMIVGSIGSQTTRSYTVIGDTVNLASRLENANRFYGTRVLVCEHTQAGAGPAIVTREIDTIVTKGKSEATRVFEVLGLRTRIAEFRAAPPAADWSAVWPCPAK